MVPTPITSEEKSRDFYASVSWCAEDIQTLRPDWSDEKRREFLEENEDAIQCGMIHHGWTVIESLLPPKEGE